MINETSAELITEYHLQFLAEMCVTTSGVSANAAIDLGQCLNAYMYSYGDIVQNITHFGIHVVLTS